MNCYELLWILVSREVISSSFAGFQNLFNSTSLPRGIKHFIDRSTEKASCSYYLSIFIKTASYKQSRELFAISLRSGVYPNLVDSPNLRCILDRLRFQIRLSFFKNII